MADKGDYERPLLALASRAYRAGDIKSALLYNLVASEIGYEIGNSNVAYLLDKG